MSGHMYPRPGMGAVPPSTARLDELLEQVRGEVTSQTRQAEHLEQQSMLTQPQSKAQRLRASSIKPCFQGQTSFTHS